MNEIAMEQIATIDRVHLLKVVSMINGIIKAFNNTEAQILDFALKPMIESIWMKILAILSTRPNEIDLILSTCKMIQNINTVLGQHIGKADYVQMLSQALFAAFEANSKNYSCLAAIA